MTAYPSIGFPLPYILFSLLRTPQLNLKIAATTVTEWIYCPPHGATTGLYWILPTYWKVIMLGRCVIIAWLWLLLLLLQAACGCPSLPRDLRLIYKYYHTSKPYPWFSSITISQHHSARIPGSTAIWICVSIDSLLSRSLTCHSIYESRSLSSPRFVDLHISGIRIAPLLSNANIECKW